MEDTLVLVARDGAITSVMLNAPEKRNAMTLEMFDALDEALDDLADADDCAVVRLEGRGKSFCAGFDLTAAQDEPKLTGAFIHRLSATVKALRRLPQTVIGGVQGAAIAGGCALVSGCDLVVASANAKFGYPVHRLGISPVVSYPTFSQAVGAGTARRIMLEGRLFTGAEAHALGLVSHLVDDHDDVTPAVDELAHTIAGHGHEALRVTKQWLNELDGSDDDARYAGPAKASAEQATQPQAIEMLAAAWRR